MGCRRAARTPLPPAACWTLQPRSPACPATPPARHQPAPLPTPTCPHPAASQTHPCVSVCPLRLVSASHAPAHPTPACPADLVFQVVHAMWRRLERATAAAAAGGGSARPGSVAGASQDRFWQVGVWCGVVWGVPVGLSHAPLPAGLRPDTLLGSRVPSMPKRSLSLPLRLASCALTQSGSLPKRSLHLVTFSCLLPFPWQAVARKPAALAFFAKYYRQQVGAADRQYHLVLHGTACYHGSLRPGACFWPSRSVAAPHSPKPA